MFQEHFCHGVSKGEECHPNCHKEDPFGIIYRHVIASLSFSEQALKHMKNRKLNAHFNLCIDHSLTTTTKQVKALSLSRLGDLADCYPVLRALISNM